MKEVNFQMDMLICNFNGFYEIRHLPRSGGFLEQDAGELEKLLLVKSFLNSSIREKRKMGNNT